MHPVERKQVKEMLKHFAKPYYLPKTVYRRKCVVDSEEFCEGKGNTCASEDVPESWSEWLSEFCRENNYYPQEVNLVLEEIKEELTELIPDMREAEKIEV